MKEEITEIKPRFASKLEQRLVFFFVSMGVITLTYAFLFIIDFLPEKPTVTEEVAQEEVVEVETETETETPAVNVDAYPNKIIFDSLDREVVVLNPETASIEALDAALLSGVVRHPDSADFNDTGTIFLLGHSSYLPVVRNKNFQAFNGIEKLEWGDTIRLRSDDMEYVYSVDRIYQTKASDASVDIERGVSKLILATCNSFGTKDDRFIVEATLVKSIPLGK